MQLTERHLIGKQDPRGVELDAVCFRSKNLYNLGLYHQRQQFFATGGVWTYEDLDQRLQPTEAYRDLPAKVSQQVVMQVCRDWKAYAQALESYQANPATFQARPRLPGYKHKTEGRNVTVYTIQAISRPLLRKGFVKPSQTTLKVRTNCRHQAVACVRIVPQATHYVVEVVHDVTVSLPQPDPTRIAGIDLGIDNFAAIASTVPGCVPLVVNGRPLKSLNARYNQAKARLQAALPPTQTTSHRIESLTDHRNRQVDNYLHHASRFIITSLVAFGIGTLVIGKNDGWKQAVDLGNVTNQNFTFLPHARFIRMLEYKAHLVGIKVVVVEESSTSKCSALDLEPLAKSEAYLGRRIKRGLFRSAQGRFLNADINAAANIIRKAFPNAFTVDGIQAVVVPPVRITPYKLAKRCFAPLPA